ncbi:hypothetical protein Cflav_PD1047 [Pedosphaera parvula Ellin514]|uniref:Uncharacterized protein n=1 Tax=Pedosphaera parvula (strain Ellin514) TaxID=320771 RepID=B9XNV8_PEDPL|nr:hypothetical protein Cflav_PD1047 [Pedosphaera parvula Ellin514]
MAEDLEARLFRRTLAVLLVARGCSFVEAAEIAGLSVKFAGGFNVFGYGTQKRNSPSCGLVIGLKPFKRGQGISRLRGSE